VRSVRALVALTVATTVLVLLLAAVLLAGRRGPAIYPDGSPEATVQAYFQAIIGNDPIAMHAQYTEEIRDRCRPPAASEIAFLPVTRVRLDAVDSDDDGDHVTVRVSITQDWGGGPFAADETTFDETFRLVDTAEGWRIEDQAWPYIYCQSKD
jgi:hypothetical protein